MITSKKLKVGINFPEEPCGQEDGGGPQPSAQPAAPVLLPKEPNYLPTFPRRSGYGGRKAGRWRGASRFCVM